jgi:peptide/nickel transport system substrate-binding protein
MNAQGFLGFFSGRPAMRKGKLLVFTAVFWLAVSLGAGASPAGAGQGEIGDIRISDGKGDWGFPNPFRHYPRGPGYIRMSWVFDTLVWKDKNGYVPALAKTWRFDPKTLSFTFSLQEKALWHDGRPFTAQDVVFSLNYFQKHPYPWAPLPQVAEARAAGPHEVTVRLEKPFAPFFDSVAGNLPILPRHIWEKVADPQRFDGPQAFVGSGPYLFKDFSKAKGTYLFKAFDRYYQGRPLARRLIYLRAANPLMVLSTGQADLAEIKPEMAPVLKEKGLAVMENQRGWNKKLMINHKIAPFDNRRFRQALAHAMDQKEIIDKAHRGLGSPASYGLLSKDHEWHNPDTPAYAPDPVRAGSLIESLGYVRDASGFYAKDGGPLKVQIIASKITVAGEPQADRDGEVIKQQLERAGVAVELINLEQATADGRVKNWQFQLAVSGHGGILGDAGVLERMTSPKYQGSVNSARYGANPRLLELLKAQEIEMDPERRKAMVYEIQKLYAEELPAISLYYPQSMAAYNPKKGITWFYTKGGIGIGVPIPQNKMALLPAVGR